MSFALPFKPVSMISLPQNKPWVVGAEVMQPQMWGQISSVSQALPFPGREHLSTERNFYQKVKQNTLNGVGILRTLKDSLRFAGYYRYLQGQIRAQLASDELVRVVYDARGWPRIPPNMKPGRVEGHDPSGIPEVDAAYDNAGYCFEFFRDHLGVIIPQPLIQVVNYDDNILTHGYANAMFAPMMFGAKLLIYGKGDGRLFNSPVFNIDIMGHELAHFFLHSVYPDKFSYQNQPGALNEHIADVVGICVKARAENVQGNRYPEGFWRIGAGWMVDSSVCVRDMMNPGRAYNHVDYGKDRQPDHMKDFKVMKNDAGGVHMNSGIMNRLFAILASAVETEAWDLPLKIWLKTIERVGANPSFRDFAEMLMVVAEEFDTYPQCEGHYLSLKMKAAVQITGVVDYVVVGGKVLPAGNMKQAA